VPLDIEIPYDGLMWGRVTDRRGVVWFLGLTLAGTWAVDAVIVAIAKTVPWAYGAGVALTMFVPAACALIVRRFVSPPKGPGFGLRLGPLRYYGWVWLVVPALFAGTYAVTWLTGVGRFDPSLTYVFELVRSMGYPESTPGLEILKRPSYLPFIIAGSLTYAPFVNSVPAFGEELGWRGFLWPRLAPMGFWPASIVLGVIWGLWHAPIVAILGFNYPGHPVLGVIFMCAMTTLLGTWVNWLRTKTGSTLLAAWIHGVFNSQVYGFWRAATYPVDDLVGGFTGVIGLAFLALPAVWLAATGRLAPAEGTVV
jgi:membrane protease YdiL (CAAX protease family)